MARDNSGYFFRTPGGSPSSASVLSVVAKTTTYLATISDDVILCSGSAFTLTLYAASGNVGKVLRIKKTDSSLTNIITIDANLSETIDGALNVTLNTLYEEYTIVCDGSNWHILTHLIPATYTTWTPTGTWSTNTTYTGWRRRVGTEEEYIVHIALAGAPTSAALILTLPSGITIETTSGTYVAAVTRLGDGEIHDFGVETYPVVCKYASSTTVSIYVMQRPATTVNDSAAVTQAVPHTFGNTDTITVRFRVPVVGWKG